MRLRSLLFVPGDRPDRMDKALVSGADALILDLEDSVTPDAKPQARQAVAAFLARPHPGVGRWVRVNPLDSGMVADDLAAAHGADGIVLPKAQSGEDVARLDAMLAGPDPVPTPAAKAYTFDDVMGALKAAVVTPAGADKVRAAVLAVDIPVGQTSTGWGAKFSEQGQNTRAVPFLMQWQGGNLVTVFPADAAVAKMKTGIGANLASD